MARSAQPSRATPSFEATAWDLEPLVDGEGADGRRAQARRGLERAQAFAERHAGKLGELDAPACSEAMSELADDQRAGRPRRLLRRAALLDRHRRSRQRRAAAARAGAETAIQTTLLFFELEWAALADERAEELLAGDGLDFCRHHLRNVRRYREHLLSEPEEKILAEKALTGAAPGRACSRSSPRRSRSSCPPLPSERADPAARSISRTATHASRSTSRSAASRSPIARSRRTTAEAVTAALAPGCARARSSSTRCSPTRRPTTGCAATEHWLAARNLANEASDESVQALIEAVRAPLRDPAALVPAEGPAARRRAARRLRPHGVGHRGRGHLPVRAGARDRARLLLVLLARARRARQALLRRALDRRAGAPGQARRRVLRLRGALRAPLRAAQLHRPPARRADARPRARPRRALRARRAPGHLPPEHAADARRDRLGVRRDDRLRAAARRGLRARPRASRCWPRTSRTRSPRSSARSR